MQETLLLHTVTDDLRERLQAALGTTYLLDRELGGGGMSRVFTATDNALGRTVVVKVLPPELAAGVSIERFKREISVAARLQHPHIVPLLAAGEMGGVPWFTMPFVDGESLRARLTRRGELPVNESVRILREIASALAYAHDHGVVHRDIKPDNVLLSGDVAMVADFGVAKALSAATQTPTDDAPVTSLGVALGTPAYMAPEQATADPLTDQRADVYAFGIVAYEVLTGQPPFSARSPAQLLAAHVTEVPEAVTRRRPSVPPALAALVMRCLEKRPADRPQQAGEIVHALDDLATSTGSVGAATNSTLQVSTGSGAAIRAPMSAPRVFASRRRLGIAVVALGALAASAALWNRRAQIDVPGANGTEAPLIAVLPFENLGDSSDAYFADGMTDAVRGRLTALSSMQVIARVSSTQYRGAKKSPAEIARELGVRYLLTGTVRWAKDAAGASQVQVSPELVEIASNGTASSRWQQPFDAQMADVFRVQGDIAGRVAEAMNVAIGGGDRARMIEVPTRDPRAYEAFLHAQALYWQAQTPAQLRESAAAYERAIAIDSGYAAAWAGRAIAESRIYGLTSPTPALAERVRLAAERAQQLAPGTVLAHSALAIYYGNVLNDQPRSLGEFEKAHRLAPNDAELLARMASALVFVGRIEEGLELARKSQRLDPRSFPTAMRLHNALFLLRRFAEAHEAAKYMAALSYNVTSVEAQAKTFVGEGNLAGARAVLQEGARRLTSDAVVADVMMYTEFPFALDDAQLQRVMTLGPDAYDGEKGIWALGRSQTAGLRGDSALMRAWGDSAARFFSEPLRATPNDGQLHMLLATSLAYAGRATQAIAEGRRAVELVPEAKDYAINVQLRERMAQVLALTNQREESLDVLEGLLAQPGNFSPGWLRIDPGFASLRGHPRFEKLIAQ